MQSLPPASCSAHCWGLSEQRFEMLSSGNLMYRTVQEKRRNCTTLVCSKASPVVPSFGEPVLSIQKRLGGHLECALLPLLDFHANLIYRNFSFHYQRRRSHLLPFPAFAFCPFQIPFAIVISSYVVKSAFCRGRTYPPGPLFRNGTSPIRILLQGILRRSYQRRLSTRFAFAVAPFAPTCLREAK